MHRRTLLAAATPTDRPATRGMLELRVIKDSIARSRRTRAVVLESTSIDGLRRLMLSCSPHLVHLIAHGSEDGLVFEDEHGYAQIVAHEHLAAVLLAHHPPLEHAVFSACYSTQLARMLALGGVAAVGLRGRATAAAAVEFSRGLHDALGTKRSFEFAVGEGLRTVAVHGHALSVELHVPQVDHDQRR